MFSLLFLLSSHAGNLDVLPLWASCSDKEARHMPSTHTHKSEEMGYIRRYVDQWTDKQTDHDSLCVDVELLCGDPLCGRLEKKCWITLRSAWLGTQMCSSAAAVNTSALELFLLLDQLAVKREEREDETFAFAPLHNSLSSYNPAKRLFRDIKSRSEHALQSITCSTALNWHKYGVRTNYSEQSIQAR